MGDERGEGGKQGGQERDRRGQERERERGEGRRRECSSPPDVDLVRRLVKLLVRHVSNHRELLDARREDHLAHEARAALAVLGFRVGLSVHRQHRELEQVLLALGQLHGRAEEVEAAELRRALESAEGGARTG